MEITTGTKVRSFDFAQFGSGRDLTGDRACYVEGIVQGIDSAVGYDRYIIKVTRDVFGGQDMDRRVGETVYPPVNGTLAISGVTDYVEAINESH